MVCYWVLKVKVKVKLLSRVRLFATPWSVAYQASPSMGFSRQEYWSRLPFPSPEDLPNLGIEPRSPALEADALTSEPPGKLRRMVLLSNSSCVCVFFMLDTLLIVKLIKFSHFSLTKRIQVNSDTTVGNL